MKRPLFLNNYIYHVYNRGVDKRKVFLDDQDHFRFVHDLYEFNDKDPVVNINYRFRSQQSKSMGVELPYIPYMRKERKLLVDILVWCLMPNHFHLIVKQRRENGIRLFMQKLSGGYTNYFNLKYKRTGALFQGRFKAILVDKDDYLQHLINYIHSNPLKLMEPNWKEEGIKNMSKSKRFLNKYRWSSYLDYKEEKNFPSVIRKDFILQLYGDFQSPERNFWEWVKGMNQEDIKYIIFD